MVQMGTYEELLVSSPEFAQLLEDINQHELEQQQSVSLTNQRSMIGSIHSEKDVEEEEVVNSLPTNIERKEEGTVKLNVYVSYLRAGVGVIMGFVLILVIFSASQAIMIYSNWWLATWSDDESRRYRNSTNCMNIRDEKTDKIQRMNGVEWKNHRDQRFYILCG